MGLNSDYIYSNVSHYYSSHDLRLFYKGSLETKEFDISKFLGHHDLKVDQLPFLAILLNSNKIFTQTNEIKKIYEKLKIDLNIDFEIKFKKVMEILKKSPTSDIDEFIKIHNLCDNSKILKEMFNYYQNKLKGKKAQINTIKNQKNEKKNAAPSTNGLKISPESTNSENSKNLKEQKDDSEKVQKTPATNSSEISDEKKTASVDTTANVTLKNDSKKQNATDKNKTSKNVNDEKLSFVYTLPAEVIKTALNRHQRGIMDSRIYHLLTKKEIILPQVCKAIFFN